MSLRKKLLSLIDKIEDLDLEEELAETLEGEVEEIVEEIDKPAVEFVEVSDEDSEEVLDFQRKIIEFRSALSDLVFRYEKTKQYYISQISDYNDEIQKNVESLRDKYNLPKGVEYTFTLPESGRSASFELNNDE
jgi:hypothetical protein